MTFPCGHEMTDANTAIAGSGVVCRQCKNANAPKHDRLVYRVRILPEQLERARRRVQHLEAEAASLGLYDLLACHAT